MYNSTSIDKEIYNQLMCSLKDINKLSRLCGNNARLNIDDICIDKAIKYCKYKWKTRHFVDTEDLPSAVNDRNDCDYFCNDRIAIYTCIVGEYDRLLDPVFIPNNCDFYAITDSPIDSQSRWNRIDCNRYLDTKGLTNAQINRYYKFFPYKVFSQYKYSIYIDGNFQIISDLTEHVNRMSAYGISFFLHSKRNCAYQEIDACVNLGKGNKEKLLYVLDYYKKIKYPRNYGLLACNFIVRNHDCDFYKPIMEEWWKCFNSLVDRDQISLPYILFKHHIFPSDIATLGGDVHKDLSFNIVKHK